jgi:surface carbohydrate biosynthesis protein
MNIYLHVEISARELDSKLLLAVLAASKGHQVMISSLGDIINGVNLKILKPGIFHTKSLTPGEEKIKTHQKIIDKGFKITSIDEEAGIGRDGYDKAAISRYSDLTIKQSSAVFCWGPDDTNTLKKIYFKHSNKIHKTGSPRIDLWKPFFSDYWVNPKEMPTKPYLLISSNFNCVTQKPFYEDIKFLQNAGYFERNPDLYKDTFYNMSEDYKKLYEFIDAIKYLAKKNNGYEIVLRPHPRDNLKAWKTFLQDIPNVNVIQKDSITVWIKNAFAIMHNGCTSAIEATITGKPVLTYSPFEMKYSHEIPNTTGYNLRSKEELLTKANNIFNEKEQKKETTISKLILKKIYIDDKNLAAEKIIKVWESLYDDKLSNYNNWFYVYFVFKIIHLKRVFRKILGKLSLNKFKTIKINHKFPKLNNEDIYARVNRLQKLLFVNQKVECKIIADRTILIKKL